MISILVYVLLLNIYFFKSKKKRKKKKVLLALWFFLLCNIQKCIYTYVDESLAIVKIILITVRFNLLVNIKYLSGNAHHFYSIY